MRYFYQVNNSQNSVGRRRKALLATVSFGVVSLAIPIFAHSTKAAEIGQVVIVDTSGNTKRLLDDGDTITYAGSGSALSVRGSGNSVNGNNITITAGSESAAQGGSGASTAGVSVTSGGRVTLADSNVATLGGGLNAHALHSTDENSLITINGGKISTVGNVSYGVLANNGARIELNDNNITTMGNNSSGVRVTNNAVVNLQNTNVSTESSRGVDINSGNFEMDGGSVTANADAVFLGTINLNTLSTAKISNATLTAKGSNSYGININGINASVEIDNVVISSDGGGVWIPNPPVANVDTRFSAKNFKIYSGKVGVDNRRGHATLVDGEIETSEINAHGLYADRRRGWAEATIEATNVKINTKGDGAVGAYVLSSGAKIELDHVNINTTGSNAHGLFASGVNSSLSAYKSQIKTNGTGANGLSVSNSSIVTLDNTKINTSGTDARGIWSYVTSPGTSNTVTIRNGSDISTQNAIGLLASGGNHTFLVSDSDIIARSEGDIDNGILLYSTEVIVGGSNIESEQVTLDASKSKLTGDILVNSGLVDVSLKNGSVLTGAVVTGRGIANELSVETDSTWNIRGASSLVTLKNAGTVSFTSPADISDFKTLTINNYIGGGTLVFNTKLDDDTSLTDKLVIAGDATGTTYVKVNNAGGAGAQTLEGIELITTGGSTADAFVQDGRIVAGSYDYSLQQGTASGLNTNNWYLTSEYIEPDDDGKTHIYRPEVGGYATNLAAAATMFNLGLNDRQGESYIDRTTGERRTSNIWMRYEGTHTRNQMIGGQLDNKANRSVFQLGGDVLGGSFNDNDLWRLGVMAGYGQQNTATRNNISGYRTDASVSGYSVGLYGTWYQNGHDHSGLYVDSWVLYNWFDNTIKGDEQLGESYKSKGFSASIEGGYNFLAGTVNGLGGVANNVFIRPQGQVIWSGVKADDHTEINGTQVSGLGDGNVQTRLGVRMSLSPVDRQASYSLMPFIEANWLHNTKRYGVEMGGISSYIDGSRNVGEIKIGLEGNFNDNFSAWGSLGHQMGSNSYRETTGIVGVKYRF